MASRYLDHASRLSVQPRNARLNCQQIQGKHAVIPMGNVTGLLQSHRDADGGEG